MKYNNIDICECCNGKDIGMSLYTQYCPIRCPGCFNKEAWSEDGGYEYTADVQHYFLTQAKRPYIKRVALLGGETMLPQNTPQLLGLVNAIKKERPDIKIWCWTGQLFEDLIRQDDWYLQELIGKLDYLIDGPFIQEQKDLTLLFRGSKNQRIIDIPATLANNNEIILADFEED